MYNFACLGNCRLMPHYYRTYMNGGGGESAGSSFPRYPETSREDGGGGTDNGGGRVGAYRVARHTRWHGTGRYCICSSWICPHVCL
jgi:hypothetical protein